MPKRARHLTRHVVRRVAPAHLTRQATRAMTGTQFQALLHAHGLRHRDVAELLDITTRTVERYVASKKVPRVVEFALRYAIQTAGIKPR